MIVSYPQDTLALHSEPMPKLKLASLSLSRSNPEPDFPECIDLCIEIDGVFLLGLWRTMVSNEKPRNRGKTTEKGGLPGLPQ